MKRFWNWTEPELEAEESAPRVLTLNGTIAEESWLDDDVTPEAFRAELLSGSGDVVVMINSPGGDCVAASQIYTMLTDYSGKVTVKIDGLAASAASVIAMAGDTVQMAPTALMMIHNPATVAFGDHVDMEKAIAMLDEVKESIINAYALKTNLSRAKLSRMMENETWMNAKKAMELGFADEMLGKSSEEAYAFSASAIARDFTNKIAKKAEQPQGAKVSDLRNALYEKLLKF